MQASHVQWRWQLGRRGPGEILVLARSTASPSGRMAQGIPASVFDGDWWLRVCLTLRRSSPACDQDRFHINLPYGGTLTSGRDEVRYHSHWDEVSFSSFFLFSLFLGLIRRSILTGWTLGGWLSGKRKKIFFLSFSLFLPLE